MKFDLQKATITKRLSAYILDLFIVILLAAGLMALIYDVVDYDSKANELQLYYKEYEDKYGIDTQLSAEEIAKLPQADQDKYAEASNVLPRFLYFMVIPLISTCSCGRGCRLPTILHPWITAFRDQRYRSAHRLDG